MPFGPSATIRDAVKKLLDQKEGFVVFDDGNDDEYVQYSLEPRGLMFNWPTMLPSYASRVGDVAALLREFDFCQSSGDLDIRMYEVADDGIYAQFGRDAERIESFTLEAFRRFFRQSEWLKLRARVES